jgi:hypothetical protein
VFDICDEYRVGGKVSEAALIRKEDLKADSPRFGRHSDPHSSLGGNKVEQTEEVDFARLDRRPDFDDLGGKFGQSRGSNSRVVIVNETSSTMGPTRLRKMFLLKSVVNAAMDTEENIAVAVGFMVGFQAKYRGGTCRGNPF